MPSCIKMTAGLMRSEAEQTCVMLQPILSHQVFDELAQAVAVQLARAYEAGRRQGAAQSNPPNPQRE